MGDVRKRRMSCFFNSVAITLGIVISGSLTTDVVKAYAEIKTIDINITKTGDAGKEIQDCLLRKRMHQVIHSMYSIFQRENMF